MFDIGPRQVKTALISVSDKTGIELFAKRVEKAGVRLLSTGGTARLLREAGCNVTDVSEVTGFPEIMGGRVKTLHPAIHGGVLARRDKPNHLAALKKHEIGEIDMVVVNLYPFAETIACGADFETAIENIDVGGPAMIRAAAKNHTFVTIVTDPSDYDDIADALDTQGTISADMRRKYAAKAFARTFTYDKMITDWLSAQTETSDNSAFAANLILTGSRDAILRYGENPHQSAAVYKSGDDGPSVVNATQLQGKPLSYNNINDTDAALRLVAEFDKPAIAIIKHANPCGVACAENLTQAWHGAFDADPVSAFGGIIACNRILEADAAREIAALFTEVVIAPHATEEARAILAKKKNLRVLVTGSMPNLGVPSLEVKSILGGYLVQDADTRGFEAEQLKIVTKAQPSAAQRDDMIIAWQIAKHVKSNAIVYVKDGISAGIGAGQMSRVDSCRIAAHKAADAASHHGWDSPRTIGSVVASDAFFPFADGLLTAIEAGARAVIQPGGSLRDEEVIAAADEAGIVMGFTGQRHFNH
tara:strand:- start:1803 stop:3398 length:1596 start_codon:yes stop_codon:yes gene_type:complete